MLMPMFVVYDSFGIINEEFFKVEDLMNVRKLKI
jgi:hypothetical protein